MTTWSDGQVMGSSCGAASSSDAANVIVSGRAHTADAPSGIASDGVNVYWTDDGESIGGTASQMSQLLMCPVSGCRGGPTVLVRTSVWGIAVDDGDIYWTTSFDGDVRRCQSKACSTAPVVLWTSQKTDPLARRTLGIAVDGEFLYWTTGSGELMKCQRRDCAKSVTALIPSSAAVPLLGSLALDDTTVYLVDSTNGGGTGSILYCPKAGCPDGPAPVVTGLQAPYDVAVKDSAIYWSEVGTGSVRRCDIPDCPGGPTLVVGNLKNPGGLTAGTNAVYWVERGTGLDGSGLADGKIWVYPTGIPPDTLY